MGLTDEQRRRFTEAAERGLRWRREHDLPGVPLDSGFDYWPEYADRIVERYGYRLHIAGAKEAGRE